MSVFGFPSPLRLPGAGGALGVTHDKVAEHIADRGLDDGKLPYLLAALGAIGRLDEVGRRLCYQVGEVAEVGSAQGRFYCGDRFCCGRAIEERVEELDEGRGQLRRRGS